MNAAAETGRIRVHLSLNVVDVDRSVAFYEVFFGVQAHKRRPGYANFDLANPPLKLALNQSIPSLGRGSLDHLGFQMASTDEVAEARRRLEESGLVQFDEGDTVCCYARQDKVWVQDPDGNRWEVYVLLEDMVDDDLADEVTDESGCCVVSDEPVAIGFQERRG